MQIKQVSRVIWLIVLILVISSCQSTDIDAPKPNLELNPAELQQDSIFTFNSHLEEALNTANLDIFANHISTMAIAEKLTEQAPQIFSSTQQVNQTAAKFKSKILESVTLSSPELNWEYLYSETQSPEEVASYYRLETSDGYNYFIFWLNSNTFQIFDFHPVSFELSGLNFLIQFSTIMIENSTGDNKQLVEELISAVQSQNINQIVDLYIELQDSISSQRLLDDFILRSIGQFAVGENYFTLIEKVISNFEKQGKTSLMFEAYYFQKNNFEGAIKAVRAIDEFALNDSKMQSELAVLYGYNENYPLALEHARAAIISNPLDEEAYFSLLQIAFFSENHSLATQVIDVLVAKFDYIIDTEVISSLDNHQAFLASDTFKNWANKHMQN